MFIRDDLNKRKKSQDASIGTQSAKKRPYWPLPYSSMVPYGVMCDTNYLMRARQVWSATMLLHSFSVLFIDFMHSNIPSSFYMWMRD